MNYLNSLSVIQYTSILIGLIIVLIITFTINIKYKTVIQIVVMIVFSSFIYFGSVVEYASGLAFNESGSITLYHNDLRRGTVVSKVNPIGPIKIEINDKDEGVAVRRNLILGTTIEVSEEDLINLNEGLK